VGNKRFRDAVSAALPDYTKATNRYEKSLVVHAIVDDIKNSGGRFLKNNYTTGRWYELSDQQAKEKVGHAVRDAVAASESRKTRKKRRPEEGKSSDLKPPPGGVPNFHQAFASLSTAYHRQAAHSPLQMTTAVSGVGPAVATVPAASAAADTAAFGPARAAGHAMGTPVEAQPMHTRSSESRGMLEQVAEERRQRLLQQLGEEQRLDQQRLSTEHDSQRMMQQLRDRLAAPRPHQHDVQLVHFGHGEAPSQRPQGEERALQPPQHRGHGQEEDHDNHFLERIDSVLGPLPEDANDPMDQILEERRRREQGHQR